MKALILVGGFGTRLRPLTCTTPKALLPIANKPFLEYQLLLLKRHKIKEVIFCVGYLSKIFEGYFGTGKKWGMKITYMHEKKPLGTGGAIRNASHLLDGTTIVLNGDILTDMSISKMLEFHKQKKALITIALSRVKDPTIYGLVETANDRSIKRFIEKPSWDEITTNTINAGIYIFEKGAVLEIPEKINSSVERDLFPNLLHQGKPLYGYIFNEYWLDIGSIEKYMCANFDLMLRNVDYPLMQKMIQNNLWAGKNFKKGKNTELNGCLVCGNDVSIKDFTKFKGNVCVGNGVIIESGTSIEDSVILDGARIAEGVKIERSIVGKNCVIEANTSIDKNTVLGDGTIIKKYSKL